MQLSKEQLEKMFNQLYGGFGGMNKRDFLAGQKGALSSEDFDKLKSMTDADWGSLDDFRKQMGAIKTKIKGGEALTAEEAALVSKSYDALKDNSLKGIDGELEASLAANAKPSTTDENKEGNTNPDPNAPPAGGSSNGLGGADGLELNEGESTNGGQDNGGANSGGGAGAPAPDTSGTPFDTQLESFDSFLGEMDKQLAAVKARVQNPSSDSASNGFDKQLDSALGALVGQLRAVSNKDPKKAKEAAKAIDSEIKIVLKTMKDLHAQEVKEQKDEMAIEKQRLDLLDKIQKLQYSWMKQAIDIQVKASQGDAKISKAEYEEAKYDRKKLEELFIAQFASEAGDTYKTGQDAKQAGNKAKEAQAEAKEAKQQLKKAETEAMLPHAGLAGDAYYFDWDARIAGNVDRRNRYAEQDVDKIVKEGQKIGKGLLGKDDKGLLGGYEQEMANEIGFKIASRNRRRAEDEYWERQGFYDQVAGRRRAPRGGNS